MGIPVLIEPAAGNGFTAKTGEPLGLCAQGLTREESLQNLKNLIETRLANGSEFVDLKLADAANPWSNMAGIFDPDDSDVKDWMNAMAEYRDEVENDPNYR